MFFPLGGSFVKHQLVVRIVVWHEQHCEKLSVGVQVDVCVRVRAECHTGQELHYVPSCAQLGG